jgi:hypothetical protein
MWKAALEADIMDTLSSLPEIPKETTTKSLCQNSLSTGRVWNCGPPKYEIGVLTTQLQR